MCEAAFEASKMGNVGQTLAKVASANANNWLTGINATLHEAWTSNNIFTNEYK